MSDTIAFYSELIRNIKENKLNKDELLRLKNKLCKKHKVKKVPTEIEILLNCPAEELVSVRSRLLTKPNRSLSGVCVVAIMSRPAECPHARNARQGGVGPCIMCPGGIGSAFGDVPQSYTGREPATMRGLRNNFDSYLQVMNRLEQYIASGHIPEKIDLIIMGGTFPAQEELYQEEFVAYAFKAMNDFSEKFYSADSKGRGFDGGIDIVKYKEFFEVPGNFKDETRVANILAKIRSLRGAGPINLEYEQAKNETSRIRCVGLTIETRPDCAGLSDGKQMLKLGCTKVEIGVQSVYDAVLDRTNRGHSVNDSIVATRTLKDLGFKITYHMMLGLPGVTPEQDLEGLKKIFDDSNFRPDMLKLYPCMVMKGTKLYDEWKAGKFKPINSSDAAEIISEFKAEVPKYVRIMRVQRDIPTSMTEAGVDMTNLRQLVHKIMNKKGTKCGCIRCNEISRMKTGRSGSEKIDVEIKYEKYDASDGTEYFIYAEDKKSGGIIGFCRMRFPSEQSVPQITAETALIRELHVYGTALGLNSATITAESKIDLDSSTQHKGYGKKLLAMAEKIAAENGKNKIVVLSGVGARGYYKKLMYAKDENYMTKYLTK